MLSIGKIGAGPQAARYYTEQVANGREDYYAGEGEESGTWMGSGAKALGLRGEVDDGSFAGLLEGAGLRRPPAAGGVAGCDLTFRAPKSVSVLWGIAPPNVAREPRAGHDAAVRYLERRACRARRGAGGCVQVRGEDDSIGVRLTLVALLAAAPDEHAIASVLTDADAYLRGVARKRLVEKAGACRAP